MTIVPVDLSIIIVNWHSAQYLEKCIKSIYQETIATSFEIIVIDNASYDKSEKMLHDLFSQVVFIQLDKNTGFAHANNRGAEKARGHILCFLNPDTEICHHALDNAFLHIVNDKTIGALGCRLLNTDLTLQTSCILPFPTIANQMLDAEWLKTKTPQWKMWGTAPLFDKNDTTLSGVEAISGACMIIPRAVFTLVKGFSEDYFMYSEDVDLCYKINKAGYRVVYDRHDEIIHHGGKSTTDKTPGMFATIMMRESLATYFTKNKTKTYAALYRQTTLLFAFVRIVMLVIAAPIFICCGKRKNIGTMLRKWIWVLGWALGHKKGVIHG